MYILFSCQPPRTILSVWCFFFLPCRWISVTCVRHVHIFCTARKCYTITSRWDTLDQINIPTCSTRVTFGFWTSCFPHRQKMERLYRRGHGHSKLYSLWLKSSRHLESQKRWSLKLCRRCSAVFWRFSAKLWRHYSTLHQTAAKSF